ncbi:MAG TPA: beta-eliminating lyase-related protein [Mycobacteriales bacterium]|nr:beta-eliminating lyase-related protein [Mycobacteriales bacterium]
MPLTDDEARALARSLPRALSGWGRTALAEDAAALADEAARGGDTDRYGGGGVVADVEEQVRDLLGADAAVLCPSGTLAQQVALRHWCRRSPRVAMHATAHPLLHEDDALPTVQGLAPVVVGERVELDAVRAAHHDRPLGAVLVELPYRETGGQLTTYDELAQLSAWCRESGVALHVDGARLWECGPAFAAAGRSLADVVALADSVYVSLYKGLGAPGGAVLLGPADLAEHTRLWRHRLGGTLVTMWPIALGARRGLREALPQVPSWVAHAQALAAALERAGAEVVVPPVTPLLHAVLPGAPDRVEDALVEASRAAGIWLGRPQPGPREGTSRLEIAVMGPSLEVPPEEAAELLARVVAVLRG